ncbi:helix-turn-helix domain-containing protein [Chryseobacterium sp. FH1]|uniref:helix-turn-helix domain-containing protein n=1 Tax=Chryseobacterium sp. FH1 TaxID=1233951 RepID=UPI0004E2D329|nr:helix-turn-helix domain-containing protein [Chryseobacterium sp. FH1]KFC20748.1 hypothetical protein IO90_16585 [Chryseobacterium sp. FH1]
MYYLELIERFWIFNHKTKPGSTAIAFYLYLLKTAKSSDTYVFKVSDAVLSRELRVTRQTVRKTKERLQELGLIQFQTRNGLSGTYRLILDYSLGNSSPETTKVSKDSALPSSQKSDKDNKHSSTDVLIDGQAGNRDDEIKAYSPESVSDNIEIPQLPDFLNYAKTLAAYQPSLDVIIRNKYQTWKDNGWKNNSGRIITNWRSSLKSTLPFIKNTAHDNQLSLHTIPDIRRPKSNLDTNK